MIKIKKGDTVKILTGKDLDKEGLVEAIFPNEQRLFVTGINLVTKTLKKSTKNPGGGIRKITAPIDISNVIIICPHCRKPTRIQTKRVEGRRYRICRKCHKPIDQK